MLSKLEELSWISRCKLFKDEAAFAKLVDSWSGRIRKFFLVQTKGDQMLSDDLSQETFIKVWNKIPDLTQINRFSSWIYRIAYNIWLDYLRKQKLSESIDSVSIIVDTTLSDKEVNSKDRHKILIHALENLNEHEKTTLTLFYLSELSIKEIIEVTGMSEGTVKANLSRGRAKLRQLPELKKLYNG